MKLNDLKAFLLPAGIALTTIVVARAAYPVSEKEHERKIHTMQEASCTPKPSPSASPE